MEQWATKEGFFKVPVPRERVSVKDLGDVWIHGLTCGQVDDYENAITQIDKQTGEFSRANARANMLRLTVHDQHGNPMFAEKDMGKLIAMPAAVANPLLHTARKLSGMMPEAQVKNSSPAQGPPAGA